MSALQENNSDISNFVPLLSRGPILKEENLLLWTKILPCKARDGSSQYGTENKYQTGPPWLEVAKKNNKIIKIKINKNE